jgi:hypothetical protein
MSVADKPFHSSLMFVVRARVEHPKGASLGLSAALPTNIRLGWKGLSWTNSLAYYDH